MGDAQLNVRKHKDNRRMSVNARLHGVVELKSPPDGIATGQDESAGAPAYVPNEHGNEMVDPQPLPRPGGQDDYLELSSPMT